MKKIKFTAKLIYSEFNQWKLNPLDKNSLKFVPENRHNNISFHKIFGEFKDETILKFTIQEVKKKWDFTKALLF